MERGNETDAVELAALLDAGDGATVTLAAGGTQLVAHRALLAARSPVFASMFRRGTPEARSGHVSVAEVEGPVLRHLLAYMYTLQVLQLPNMAAEMLSAADKYGLPVLKGACEQQVVAQLSVENAAAAAVLAERCRCPALRQAAVAFIQANYRQVVWTRGWEDSAVSHPHLVVELTRLVIEPPSETSTPATAESGTTAGTLPHSDHGRSRGPAAKYNTRRRTPPPGEAAVSHVCAPAAAEGVAAPSARPHGGHGRRSPVPPAQRNASRHAAPPEDAAVSRLRWVPQEERSRRLIEAAQRGAVEDVQAELLT